MVDVKPILRAATAAQAAMVADKALRLAKKRKKKASDFLKVGTESLAGTILLKEQDDFIGSL